MKDNNLIKSYHKKIINFIKDNPNKKLTLHYPRDNGKSTQFIKNNIDDNQKSNFKINCMTAYKGSVFVGTDKGLYYIDGDSNFNLVQVKESKQWQINTILSVARSATEKSLKEFGIKMTIWLILNVLIVKIGIDASPHTKAR